MKIYLGQCLLQFDEQTYTVTVTETPSNDSDIPFTYPAPPTTGVLVNVSCSSSDNTSPADLRYSILSGAEGTAFSVDWFTGEFSVSERPFDYEEQPWYSVSLLCYLASDSSHNATATLNVTIAPLNEYLPSIDEGLSSSVITIPEDTPVGTTIAAVDASIGPLLTYAVSDRDAGSDGLVLYTLDQDANVFELGSITGTLSLSGYLDIDDLAEQFQRLEISVTACNDDIPLLLCPIVALTVFVTAANDNAPQYRPSNYTDPLLESASPGSLVTQTLCVDADNGPGSALSYSFHRDTTQLVLDAFQINTAGAVLLKRPLDYETDSLSYSFKVVCSDGESEAVAEVTVSLLPVNDNAPQFNEDHYDFSVDRISPAGHAVGEVEAADADIDIGNNITYSVNGSSFFDISSLTGRITIKEPVPSSEGSRFELTVLATDGEFEATTTVSVSVKGAITLPEFAGIIAGIVIFIVLVVGVILAIGLCCCFYIRATRKRYIFFYVHFHSCLVHSSFTQSLRSRESYAHS